MLFAAGKFMGQPWEILILIGFLLACACGLAWIVWNENKQSKASQKRTDDYNAIIDGLKQGDAVYPVLSQYKEDINFMDWVRRTVEEITPKMREEMFRLLDQYKFSEASKYRCFMNANERSLVDALAVVHSLLDGVAIGKIVIKAALTTLEDYQTWKKNCLANKNLLL